MNSIQRYLVFTLLSVLAVSIVISTFMAFTTARHEVEEVYDAQLAQVARVLRGVLDAELSTMDYQSINKAITLPGWGSSYSEEQIEAAARENSALVSVLGHWYESKIAFQLWHDSKLLLATEESHHAPFADFTPGFSEYRSTKESWRVFSIQLEKTRSWLFVAQRNDVREEAVSDLAIGNAIPGLLLFPVTGLVALFFIQRGMRPLKEMATAISKRHPNNLRPFKLEELPKELTVINQEINTLLLDLQRAFEREKRFTADAAHELRTPLAVIKVHTQNALQSNSKPQQQRALDNLLAGVDRATHLVGQLLALARVSADENDLTQDISFGKIVRNEIAMLSELAVSKHQELVFEDFGERAMLVGNEIGIRSLVRNLVDNAIRYTPANGGIFALIKLQGDCLVFSIRDSGPGINNLDRETLFRRFARGDTKEVGSGLGLSIVKRVADQHQATIDLQPNENGLGLCFNVIFPRERFYAA